MPHTAFNHAAPRPDFIHKSKVDTSTKPRRREVEKMANSVLPLLNLIRQAMIQLYLSQVTGLRQRKPILITI